MSNGDTPKLILSDDWRGEKEAKAASKQEAPAAPKLVVDSDWKNEAQAEKDKMAEAAKTAGAKSGKAAGQRELPPADFKTLVGTMVTQAGMYLGWFPDAQGRAVVSMEYAKFHIDLIGVLAEKCKGNITAEEQAELLEALQELRGQFVEVGRAVAQAAAEKLKGGAGGTGGGMSGGMGGGMGAGGMTFGGGPKLPS